MKLPLLSIFAAIILGAASTRAEPSQTKIPGFGTSGAQQAAENETSPPTHVRKARKRSSAKGGDKAIARRAKVMAVVKEVTPKGMPVALVDAIIARESGYNANARGSRGEIGLMQILPSTARQIAKKLGMDTVAAMPNSKLRAHLTDARNNLTFGVTYLSTCHKMAKGNVAATIGCYNAGPGNMWHWSKIEITRSYVHFVRSHMAKSS